MRVNFAPNPFMEASNRKVYHELSPGTEEEKCHGQPKFPISIYMSFGWQVKRGVPNHIMLYLYNTTTGKQVV